MHSHLTAMLKEMPLADDLFARTWWRDVVTYWFRTCSEEKRLEAFKTMEEKFSGSPYAWAEFLAQTSNVLSEKTDAALRLRYAEAIVSAYSKVTRMRPPQDDPRDTPLVLLFARGHMTPERFRNEAVSFASDQIPPGWSEYPPADEFTAWLERFRKLPQFKNLKAPALVP
jgi:hypothetical protein